VRLWVKRIGLAILVLAVAIQFIRVNRSNPGVDPSQTIYATLQVPGDVKTVFERSCTNCHSDETSWPWYSYVAPVSWVVAHDVHQARKAMNLSEWGSYSANKKTDKLEEICEQLTNGDMPDRKYTLIHRRARPTAKERDVVCQWTDDSREY
jgi:Haem-binding domain